MWILYDVCYRIALQFWETKRNIFLKTCLWGKNKSNCQNKEIKIGGKKALCDWIHLYRITSCWSRALPPPPVSECNPSPRLHGGLWLAHTALVWRQGYLGVVSRISLSKENNFIISISYPKIIYFIWELAIFVNFSWSIDHSFASRYLFSAVLFENTLLRASTRRVWGRSSRSLFIHLICDSLLRVKAWERKSPKTEQKRRLLPKNQPRLRINQMDR